MYPSTVHWFAQPRMRRRAMGIATITPFSANLRLDDLLVVPAEVLVARPLAIEQGTAAHIPPQSAKCDRNRLQHIVVSATISKAKHFGSPVHTELCYYEH